MGTRRGLFVTLAVVLVLAWLAGRPPAALPPPPLAVPAAPGERPDAPDWELPDLAGRSHRLADFRGRVVVINFWATWCGPCREELPALQALAAALGGEGLAVVAISVDWDREPVARFAEQHGLEVPVLHDPTEAIARQHLANAWPTTVVVDRAGRVAYHVAGAWNWNSPGARAALHALLSEAPPARADQ